MSEPTWAETHLTSDTPDGPAAPVRRSTTVTAPRLKPRANPLAALRADVEKAKALVDTAHDNCVARGVGGDMRVRMASWSDAYQAVLDLIDKHAREGQ